MLQDYSNIADRVNLTLLETVDSTNNYIKAAIPDLPPDIDSLAAIADSQTGGRGRMGHSFASPSGTGIYLTYAFRSSLEDSELFKVTGVVAALAHQILTPYSDSTLKIKWINDLYNDSGKIAGILAELVPSGSSLWVVVGIGVNVHKPVALPSELHGIAGYLTDNSSLTRGELAGRMLDAFEDFLHEGATTVPDMTGYYRRNCLSIGRDVAVCPHAGEAYAAHSLDINDAYELEVRTPDGLIHTISSGEVSVSV